MSEENRNETSLDGAKAALTPALEATAAILSLVATPQAPRFSKALNKRWQEAITALNAAWENGLGCDRPPLRPAIFHLLNVALETGDPDCLSLAEALASMADHLENHRPSGKLIAAVTAALEVFSEEGGLEQKTFGERARHFAERIAASMRASVKPGDRSDVLDRLFAEDTRERLERMQEALTTLPIDGYVLREESQELAQQAEQIELWGVVHMARQLENYVMQLGECGESEQDRAIADIQAVLERIQDSLEMLDL